MSLTPRSVASPEPVEVVLTILFREADGQPSKALLDAVRKRVDERRPLTDRLTVQAATLLPFSITAMLALRIGPDLLPETPLTLAGFKPQIDATAWLVSEVAHNFTEQGYTCSIRMERR